jgi:hypothetical protein
MATCTVLRFETSEGAEQALNTAQDLTRQHLGKARFL